MIKSMTGFGRAESEMAPFGKISVELRSTNHKFVETIVHLPEGFLALEDKIKKEVELRISRGRVVCAINILGGHSSDVFVNKDLLAKYVSALANIKQRFAIKNDISLDTLARLPGVLSLAENVVPKAKYWPGLKKIVDNAVNELVRMRQKEGRALQVHLKSRAHEVKSDLTKAKAAFQKAIKEKVVKFGTDEERSSFLKNSDITEEIDRLAFHISNLNSKLAKTGPIGKEMDFIAQEMQREANTMGAKSCDASISAAVIEIKSKIEKIREQVQNIE